MATGELGGRSAEKLFSLSGLFAVYKPKGPTSAAVLNLLKERLLAGRRALQLLGGRGTVRCAGGSACPFPGPEVVS